MEGTSSKKRKRENSSIIWNYFFEEYDEEEQQLYLTCQICKNNNVIKRYKWSKSASTSTAQGHLWRDHKIDKDHPEEPEPTNGDIRDTIKHITIKHQSCLEESLITFIILDCQPLNILRNNAFWNMLHKFEPGFRIPTEEKCKKMKYDSYNWTKDQLQELLKSSANSINFTTDMWTSRRNDSYIGVTISWLDQEMKLHEALISIKLLPNPHTAENIKNCLENSFEEWNLKGKCFAATTDSGANVKKAISLMNNITRLNVCTRWNSFYLAWKRLLELKVAIQWLANTLYLAYTKNDKDDGDYLKLIALTENKWSSEQEEENTPDANANIDAQNRNLPISDDEDSETNSEDELVQNSIVEPRLSRISLRAARVRGQGRGSGVRRTNADSRFRNRRLIEAPVTNTAKLLEKVEAAYYLSMKEYWNVPTLTGMIATILDPWLKKLKFVNNSVIKNETIEKLRRLYSNEKFENELNAITTSRFGSASNVHQATNTSSSSNSILSALFDDDDDVKQDIDKVNNYLNLSVKNKVVILLCGGVTTQKDFLY
ncbi:unnamed protein product [Rhizophagus irregularis]|nr:unnamed protein product [Rhizophagus irregularis]